ncbi:alpha/beta fold hydrolase [Geodermatophilus sp. SYSU D01180]
MSRTGPPEGPGPVRRVDVGGAELETEVRGAGEPLLLVPTALTADELRPLAGHPALRDRYRVVSYRRRGYGHSSPVRGPGSIERDADDVRRLLAALGIGRAHVVGVSYSAAVALRLAADAPALVATLTLVEAPPVSPPHAAEFRAANAALWEDFRARGPAAALDSFLRRVVGPDWRRAVERDLPGAVAQMERDCATFFETDVPALASWDPRPQEARRIRQPALYVAGGDSGPWFAVARDAVLGWLPQAEDVVLPGAGHDLAITHAAALGTVLADFLGRHPVDGAG